MIEQNYESKSCIDRLKELEKTVNSDNRNGCMTTLELIENYGIGHNCLSDAYALGMMHGLDALENAVEFAEKKARVDAIEECMQYILMIIPSEPLIKSGKHYENWKMKTTELRMLLDMVEQLKEKNNA